MVLLIRTHIFFFCFFLNKYNNSIDQEVAGSTLSLGQQHAFVEIDHEIFSIVILSLPLIQEEQLSVSGKRMCTILVNRLGKQFGFSKQLSSRPACIFAQSYQNLCCLHINSTYPDIFHYT